MIRRPRRSTLFPYTPLFGSRGDPRRERDEGAHDGEETRPEDRLPPPAREPALGELELAVAEQHEAPPALDRRPPAARADRIRDQRAQHAAGGARDRDAREPQLAPVHEVARERHDDLRGERDARALDRHEEDDAGVAPGRDHADDEGGGGRQQAPEHGAPVYQLRAAEAR